MIQIPDSFAFGAFVGTIFGLMLYPFVIGTTKPEIRFFVPENVIMCDKKTLEKIKNINTDLHG